MLLSDDEISDLWVTELDDRKTVSAFARAIEAAILANLGAMELPEPTEIIDIDGFTNCVYDIGDLRQAYAQGAAAQLAQEPVLIIRAQDSDIIPAGTKLYTRREA